MSYSFARFGVIAVLFIFGNIIISAQDAPCFDARAGVTFKRLEKRQSQKAPRASCRETGRKAPPPRTEGEQTFTISGHVTHQNGVRMAGVTFQLTQWPEGTLVAEDVSDENGVYRLENIASDSLELTATRDGYEFYPPSIIWSGLSEDEVWNFIAVGPPPPPPPPAPGTPSLAFSSFYNHPSNLAELNPVIGRDAQGNVYLGGTSAIDDESNGTDIVIVKFDPNGNLLWSRSFNGTADYREGVADMQVAPDGDIYVTGYSYSLPDAGDRRSYDYVMLKYDTDGDQVWARRYDGFDMDDFPQSAKIDADENFYITGYSWGVGTYANYLTLKYDENGNQLWEKRYAGGFGEIPSEVEVDAEGSVYITGYSGRSSAGGSDDIVTIKYNAAGVQQWLNRYNAPADDDDRGYEIELTDAGDVVVLGESRGDDFRYVPVLHKIDGGSGSAMWTKLYEIVAGESEYPTALDLDGAGNILVAGMVSNPDDFYDYDAFVAKFDPSGNSQWMKTYDGPADGDYDGDTKMVLDQNGSVYIAVTSSGFANDDIHTIKYSATGEKMWEHRYGNPYYEGDYLRDLGDDTSQNSMLLDEQGNVYLTGMSFIPNQGLNLLVYKLAPAPDARAVPSDFDGDGKADLAVFRPENGAWYVSKSSDGQFMVVNWGLPGDKIVPADYDGDARNDFAIYRGGAWYVMKSGGGFIFNQFGNAADSPVPSDFDNDGRADLSVFRQGAWHSLASSTGAYKVTQFGAAGDKPLPADYDSNSRGDVAVFRGGSWFISYQNELPTGGLQFGVGSDTAVPADYDGDKKTDYAVFRGGDWYVWLSTSNSFYATRWGLAGDVPVPADYDGDKKADLAVYRNGIWYIQRSTDGQATIVQFGTATDIPVPAAYTR